MVFKITASMPMVSHVTWKLFFWRTLNKKTFTICENRGTLHCPLWENKKCSKRPIFCQCTCMHCVMSLLESTFWLKVFFLILRPSPTARTLLERSLNGRERGPNFDNARHRAQNGKKIENTGVALAVHRWSRRCFSVGLTVASGSERWFSGDASVDRATFCACGRWLGGGLKLV